MPASRICSDGLNQYQKQEAFIIKHIYRSERSGNPRGSCNKRLARRSAARQFLTVSLMSLLLRCSDESTTTDGPTSLEDPAVFQNQSSPFRSEVVEIVLAPGVGTEVQSVLTEDQAILYQWNTDGAVVYSDFHGHDPEDDSFWVQYRENEGGREDYGSLVAPFSGQHGWYFRNDGETEIVIRLRVSGYFSEIVNQGIM